MSILDEDRQAFSASAAESPITLSPSRWSDTMVEFDEGADDLDTKTLGTLAKALNEAWPDDLRLEFT
jgi:hypothetical protein